MLETKNDEIRQVSISGHALELIKLLDFHKKLHTTLLFSGEFPKQHVQICSAWETAVRKAGIENLRLHDLRHSCASYLAMNGASLAEITEVLGHKNPCDGQKIRSHFRNAFSRCSIKNESENFCIAMSEYQILNEKVCEYKEHLAKPCWELQAGVSILCRASEYISLGCFELKLVPKAEKGSLEDKDFWIRFHAIFKIVLRIH